MTSVVPPAGKPTRMRAVRVAVARRREPRAGGEAGRAGGKTRRDQARRVSMGERPTRRARHRDGAAFRRRRKTAGRS